MNKTYTAIIVLVLVVGGGLFLFGKSKTLEAPTVDNTQNTTTNNNTNVVSGQVSTGEVKEFVVTGQNFAFSPSTIKVKKGDKVKITFKNSAGFHDFKIDEFGVATKKAQSPSEEVLEFTADKAGSFQYYCSVGTHRAMGMWGTLIVE